MNQITEITRRAIVDEIQLNEISWCGRLEEVEFLARIFRLEELPSTDSRFPTMAGDIWQHRANNNDWDDNWIFTDERLNLLCGEDEKWLQFLCQTIHPLVRTNAEELKMLIEIFNKHLCKDGYEIYKSEDISGRPVFSARLITTPVMVDSAGAFSDEFIREQLEKCDQKLNEQDYYGAITNARTLVEAMLGEIYKKTTGEKLPHTGDLLKDYKLVKKLLSLSDEKITDGGLRGIIQGFNNVIQNLDTLSNKMGERHRPLAKPARHHAKLVVDSAKTICSFLYSSMEYQNSRKINTMNALIEILDSELRFLKREDLLADGEIKKWLTSTDNYLRSVVKDKMIQHFEVSSFRRSDIFFAAMRVLLDSLTEDDIEPMYVESQTNSQMVGWENFLEDLSQDSRASELLTSALKKIYGY